MRGSSELSMTYAVAVVLAKVEENRRIHQAIYAEAMGVYAQRMIAWHSGEARRIKRDGPVGAERYAPHSEPESHLGDYDEIIAMLTATGDDQITLSQDQFRRYMLDLWDWRSSFKASTMSYVSGG